MTEGRRLWEEHMKYVIAMDIEGMVNNTFHDDAVLYHNFPFFDTPGPYVVKGKKDIIAHEKVIFTRQGKMEVGEPFDWSESDSHICYQIVVNSPNTGRWMVTDFWYLKDHKIFQYFAYGYKLT